MRWIPILSNVQSRRLSLCGALVGDEEENFFEAQGDDVCAPVKWKGEKRVRIGGESCGLSSLFFRCKK